jgi:hypothetical protein
VKVGDLVRKHRNVHANREPWWSHGLLAIGVVLPKAPYSSNTDFTILWAGKYRTYEQKKNLKVVQERK